MASQQNFRSALNGFNRQDVVSYIELINNQHAAQVNQLKTELQTLQAELTRLRAAANNSDLQSRLTQSEENCARLERELAEARQTPAAQPSIPADSELEAYRRAERAERMANERVAQLYAQANGALADATVRADEAAASIAAAADQVTAQLTQLQDALAAGKASMQDAAATLYAIHPADPQN